MTETIAKMIAEIEELRSQLYDQETECMAHFTSNRQHDYNGDQMRRMANVREQRALLARTIKMLQEQK